MIKKLLYPYLGLLVIALTLANSHISFASTLPIGPRLKEKIYLPFVVKAVTYIQGAVTRCDSNAGITYVNGTITKGDQPVNGAIIVFSTTDSEPHIAEIISGPHKGYPNWDNGFFSIILGANGPRQGSWYFWVLNDRREKDSIVIHLHTDGVAKPGSCQQGLLRFNTK